MTSDSTPPPRPQERYAQPGVATFTCPQCHRTGWPIGLEVRGVYDGVLCWVCTSCHFYVPRFTAQDDPHLHEAAVQHAEQANDWLREVWSRS